MATTITRRAVITQDVPDYLLTLELPGGMTLDKWVEMETARIRQMYPDYKDRDVELGREYGEMFRIARHNRTEWEKRYELLKLDVREQMGWHRRGLADGLPFVTRRINNVKPYAVPGYVNDALYPV